MSKSGPRIPTPILTNALCAYGCNSIAKYKNASGRLMCDTSSSKCPEIKKKNSEGGKLSYQIVGKRKEGREIYKNLPQATKDKMAWNRGQTKETNPIIKKMAEASSQLARVQMYNKKPRGVASNPQMRWKRNHIPYIDSSGKECILDSIHEFKVANILDKNNIYWIRPEKIFLQNKDFGYYYEPDFYLRDYNVYLDPKSKWHGSPAYPGYQGYAKQNNQLKKIHQCEIEFNIHILILWSHSKKSYSWAGILSQIIEKQSSVLT